MATIAAQEYPVQAPKVENLDDVAHKVEAGVEYWETQDEADMARMGKRQQTRVCSNAVYDKLIYH